MSLINNRVTKTLELKHQQHQRTLRRSRQIFNEKKFTYLKRRNETKEREREKMPFYSSLSLSLSPFYTNVRLLPLYQVYITAVNVEKGVLKKHKEEREGVCERERMCVSMCVCV